MSQQSNAYAWRYNEALDGDDDNNDVLLDGVDNSVRHDTPAYALDVFSHGSCHHGVDSDDAPYHDAHAHLTNWANWSLSIKSPPKLSFFYSNKRI